MILTQAIQPPPEDCVHAPRPAEVIDPPWPFVEADSEARLIAPLREAAQTLDARKILIRATLVHYRARHPLPDSTQETDFRLGDALADLSASGRMAYATFQAAPVLDADLVAATTVRLAESGITATPADVGEAATAALDRAYAVAWALRGPAPQRKALRAPLGWIAVSGEDDTPHRPVNLVAPEFEQYDVQVAVGGVTAWTRCFIASAVDGPSVPLTPSARTLPPDPVPFVPPGHQVILFLHGHSSSADEALTITPEILAAGLAHDLKFSLVSFDLPNNGYAQTFDHEQIALSSATNYPGPGSDGPIHTPVLDFVEDFVVAFVDALEQFTPVKNRFAGVIGGSLGGNLGLRLGRRPMGGPSWLDAGIVSWSPASVWDPMVQDQIKSIGPARARQQWMQAETLGSRKDYFSTVYDNQIDVLVPHTQPEFWYRDDWQPCKADHIELSRIARREIYNAHYRQWHWRLAGEQLIFSHVDRVMHDDPTSVRRYTLNTVRQMLVAGGFDNYQGANIFDASRTLASLMKDTPGLSLFLLDTGHSIHFERPHFFAGEITRFLARQSGLSMQIMCTHRNFPGDRIRGVGGTDRTQNFPFRMSLDDCIASIRQGNDFFVVGADGSRAEVHVVNGPRSSYIETIRDASSADNLAALGEC